MTALLRQASETALSQTKLKPTAAQVRCIDGLRAVAVLIVILQHYKSEFVGSGGPMALLTTPGAGGVILFFVLSGLCITLSKSEKMSWLAFYARRVFRLVPALWVSMIFVFAIRFFALHQQPTLGELLGTIFVLPNYCPTLIGINPPLWSLQTELELYLLFPVSMLLYQKLTSRQFLIINSVLTGIAYIIWRISLKNFTYFPPFPAVCYLAVWNAGLLLAYNNFTLSKQKERGISPSLVWLSIGAILLLARNYRISNDFAFWYLPFGYGCYLLVRWSLGQTPLVLQSKTLGWIGKRSYVLYLIHLPVAQVCVETISHKGPTLVTALAGTLLVSELIHRSVELPFVRFGKRVTSLIPEGI